METNTLVRHKKLKSLGIGCVSKVLKSSVRVNFGLEDTITTKETQLELVDVTGTKTMTFNELKAKLLNNDLDYVIIGNELKQSVGIGLIPVRVVTEEDLKLYIRVID